MSFRLLSCLLAACLLAAPAPAQTKADYDKIEKLLNDGKAEFLSLLDKVTDEQWNVHAPNIRHSIGEEAEHIALSENDLQQVIQGALRSPEQPAAPQRLAGKLEVIHEVLLGKDAVAEGYDPPKKLINKAEVLEFYAAGNRKLMALLASSRDKPLAQHVYVHPSSKIGELTGLQWFYYIAYHRERHIRQIKALLENPAIPGAVQSAALR
ncbi:MAG: DinB family protein [Bryobacterales bacterium]|nr:DinB family protein [Acidobacteriota bacterium]MCB9384111.1 DinB family protein [Bryobacterales bacterium]